MKYAVNAFIFIVYLKVWCKHFGLSLSDEVLSKVLLDIVK